MKLKNGKKIIFLNQGNIWGYNRKNKQWKKGN